MQRLDRIRFMEEKFDRALSAVAELDAAVEKFRASGAELEELIGYYESDLWREDFEADEAGLLPAGLKRGVLSQDGIYDLLTGYQRLKELLDI